MLAYWFRKNLVSKFPERSFFFKLAFPFLFVVSFFYSLFSIFFFFLRKIISPAIISDCEMICVGNVIVGGAGKSPVVRAIAQSYLLQGRAVCIVSRGYKAKEGLFFPLSLEEVKTKEWIKKDDLTDENKENLFLLGASGLTPSLWIVQNKNRTHAVRQFLETIKKSSVSLKQKPVVIFDDGLQNLSLPSCRKLCVWEASLFYLAPFYTMPLGIYRLAWPLSKKLLLRSFDLNLWSRWSRKEFLKSESFAEDLKNRFALDLPQQNIILNYDLIVFTENDPQHLSEEKTKNVIERAKNVFICAGVANPDSVVSALELHAGISINDKLRKCFLADHSPWKEENFAQPSVHDVVFVTLKDYVRWVSSDKFRSWLNGASLHIVSLSIIFKNSAGKELTVTDVLEKRF